jgi:hypothetical protein
MRAMETTPAASLNTGEGVGFVGRAQWETNRATLRGVVRASWEGPFISLDVRSWGPIQATPLREKRASLEGIGGNSQAILLARRTRTMKGVE